MCLKSLYFYRPIRTILWGIPSILLVRVYLSSKLQTGVLIKSIDLIDNGEDILITLISGKTLRAKISGIKKPNIAIAGPAMYSYNKAGMNIIPIETNGSILMVDGSGYFFNDNLTKAIFNGICIDLSKKQDVDNKDENIIDV